MKDITNQQKDLTWWKNIARHMRQTREKILLKTLGDGKRCTSTQKKVNKTKNLTRWKTRNNAKNYVKDVTRWKYIPRHRTT